jgi:hypothetical protein
MDADAFVLWTPEETAKVLDVGEQTLADWRCKKTGPDFIRVGKKIRYTPQTVREFLESRRVTIKLIVRA